MRVLLVTPPFLQPNTPYPATCFLKAFLGRAGITAEQADLSLELLLDLFSKNGLTELAKELRSANSKSDSSRFFLEAFDDYAGTIDSVIRFLQGRDSSLAIRIANRRFVPEGPRFLHLRKHGDKLLPLFGSLGDQDKAKYIASLYLDDISDAIRCADPKYALSRSAERLAESAAYFSPMVESLEHPSFLDRRILSLFEDKIAGSSSQISSASASRFPGNLHAALRLGQHLREQHPQDSLRSHGGGFANTELRDLADARFFDFIDFVTYDDGEAPILALIEFLQDRRPEGELLRTRRLKDGRVEYISGSGKDTAFKELPAPDYSGLPLDRYISMLEMPNPMHRMWSDFRWNKMMLAHGCYWKKCSFCDTSLDYIRPLRAAKGVNTGRSDGIDHRPNRQHRISLRRRGGAAGAGSKESVGRNLAPWIEGQLVGKHPLRQAIRRTFD